MSATMKRSTLCSTNSSPYWSIPTRPDPIRPDPIRPDPTGPDRPRSVTRGVRGTCCRRWDGRVPTGRPSGRVPPVTQEAGRHIRSAPLPSTADGDGRQRPSRPAPRGPTCGLGPGGRVVCRDRTGHLPATGSGACGAHRQAESEK